MKVSLAAPNNALRPIAAKTRLRLNADVGPQKEGVWVVEHAPTGMPYLDEAIRTCLLRGWVAVLEEAVPQGALSKGQLPQGPLFNRQGAVYRLTEAGWFVINRSHTWVLATFFMALLSVLASLVALWRQ